MLVILSYAIKRAQVSESIQFEIFWRKPRIWKKNRVWMHTSYQFNTKDSVRLTVYKVWICIWTKPNQGIVVCLCCFCDNVYYEDRSNQLKETNSTNQQKCNQFKRFSMLLAICMQLTETKDVKRWLCCAQCTDTSQKSNFLL